MIWSWLNANCRKAATAGTNESLAMPFYNGLSG